MWNQPNLALSISARAARRLASLQSQTKRGGRRRTGRRRRRGQPGRYHRSCSRSRSPWTRAKEEAARRRTWSLARGQVGRRCRNKERRAHDDARPRNADLASERAERAASSRGTGVTGNPGRTTGDPRIAVSEARIALRRTERCPSRPPPHDNACCGQAEAILFAALERIAIRYHRKAPDAASDRLCAHCHASSERVGTAGSPDRAACSSRQSSVMPSSAR